MTIQTMSRRTRTLSSIFAWFLLAVAPVAPAAEHGFGRLGLTALIPPGWVEEAPSSNMRLSQFSAGAVEVIVFYFGPGQGGPVDANIERWAGQFRPIDGSPPVAVRDTFRTRGEFPVHWVELRGDYARGVGTGPIGAYVDDQMLLAAIVETPHGNLFIQAHGDRAEVEMRRKAFSGFVRSIGQAPR